MNQALVRMVWERAGGCCEYCRLPHEMSIIPFEVDHIIARKHGGPTEAENLALSCFYCNSAKGPNIAGIDPDDGAIVRLVHPRRDRWEDHFSWDGPTLRGLTPAGRATIAVLEINQLDRLAVREALIAAGLFPL